MTDLFQGNVIKLNRYLNKPIYTNTYFSVLISDKVEFERTLLHETNKNNFYEYYVRKSQNNYNTITYTCRIMWH